MDKDKLDHIVSGARQAQEGRTRDYREQALALFPHVCGRCGRGFERESLHELTVHPRDHNHDYNPADGSNWELLCIYCHDNEHQRQLEARSSPKQPETSKSARSATFNPFADIRSRLQNDHGDK